jgi:hypothetical protein
MYSKNYLNHKGVLSPSKYRPEDISTSICRDIEVKRSNVFTSILLSVNEFTTGAILTAFAQRPE